MPIGWNVSHAHALSLISDNVYEVLKLPANAKRYFLSMPTSDMPRKRLDFPARVRTPCFMMTLCDGHAFRIVSYLWGGTSVPVYPPHKKPVIRGYYEVATVHYDILTWKRILQFSPFVFPFSSPEHPYHQLCLHDLSSSDLCHRMIISFVHYHEEM